MIYRIADIALNTIVSTRFTPILGRGRNIDTIASAILIGNSKHNGLNHSSRCPGADIINGLNTPATTRLRIANDRNNHPDVKKLRLSIIELIVRPVVTFRAYICLSVYRDNPSFHVSCSQGNDGMALLPIEANYRRIQMLGSETPSTW